MSVDSRVLRLGGYATPQLRPAAPDRPEQRVRVSVVVPCYNYGRFLDQCINSILEQEVVDVDVVIVDDCSTDGSQEVVRRIAESDSRVRAIFHEVNRGHLQTYNDGLAIVDGDFIVLLSADDRLTPGSFARATALFEAHPDVGVVYGGIADEYDDAPATPRLGALTWSVWSGEDWIADRCRTGRNALRSPEAIVRTRALDKVGRDYRPELPHAGDLEMWMRVATVSDVGYIRGADQAIYRLHGNNMHGSIFAPGDEGYMIGDIQERLVAFEAVFERADGALPKRLRTLVRRTFAREILHYLTRRFRYGVELQTEGGRRLMDLSRELCPPIRLAPAWFALRVRKRIGADRVPRMRLFRLIERGRVWNDEQWVRRWKQLGI